VATAAAVVGAMIAIVACAKDRPPPTGGLHISGTSGGASGTPFAEAGQQPLPGCGEQDNGGFCDCVDTPLFADPPNIYFVLDRSGSMAQGDKWNQVRVVVAEILRGLGPRANFGATVFPGFDQTASCAPPKEILPISPGDPPGVDGPTTNQLLQTTAGTPFGGTPTAAALRFVAQILQGVTTKTFVILATDGGPNCNTTAQCMTDQCMPNIENADGCVPGGANCCVPPNGFIENCLDAAPTNSAVLALKAAGFPVYVVGLPGTTAYASLLDQLAVSGGTALPASPKYYAVGASTQNALLAALKKIAAKIIATCEFKLKEAPKSANLVNVYLDEVVLPKDPANGWKIEGATVTLLGSACSKVLAGDVLDVRIIAGCPTVEPR
jgi:von Willebrand factor type A domain